MDELSLAAESMNIDLDSTTVSRFGTLLHLLQDRNRFLNLTAVRDPDAMVRRHFIESLALGKCLADQRLFSGTPALLDLGSGAGFPGLPLKLVWPALRLTCLEATAKKARFVALAASQLGLSDVRVLAGRAETLAHDRDLRESQDVVVARAVAPLPALVELALPFLRLGGMLAAVKGSRWRAELDAATPALAVLGGEFVAHTDLQGTTELATVLIQKCAVTPPAYPRRPGQPAAHPLRGS
jgi:16S rRNA (guanine527-N7)-methyltransferase